MISFYAIGLLCLAAFGSLSSAHPVEKRAQEFNIYAFGENISGLQLYFSDDGAVIGNSGSSNGTDVVPVSFKMSDSTTSTENTLTVQSQSKAKTLTNQVLYLANDGDKVGFASSTEKSSGKLTNIWWLYGRYLMTNVEGAAFYAEESSNGFYKLSWSSGDQSGTKKVPVTLRTIEPSTNSVLARAPLEG